MASLGGEQIISSKDITDNTSHKENRPNSADKKSSRDREEKLRLIRERQNEERQRKIEELKAQAEAAQKYREQKEEERRRRIEELRNRDNDRRQQVEERKRAILEAEKERKEYILRRNQEREARLDTKRRNEKSSITFAFGSSTPRLLDPSELGNVSPSTFWGHRRSTSITNVAYTGAPLSRRSSERELSDGSKKRATSAGGIDRQNEDRRRRSTSMYEVFNWGFVNDEPPKRFPLSIAAADIDIDGPPTTTTTTTTTTTSTTDITTIDNTREKFKNFTKEETNDSTAISYRSVYRRKTDLMPTIPSPREPSFGSKSSLHSQAHTPRTPGRAISMTRLDQLAQPIRRNGEHIRAVIEREKQQQMEQILANSQNHFFPTTTTIINNNNNNKKNMSRSMIHLATNKSKHNITIGHGNNTDSSVIRPLRKNDTTKSMTQLVTVINASTAPSSATIATNRFNTYTKKNDTRYHSKNIDHKKDDAPNSLTTTTTTTTTTGSRSGEVTPKGSNNPSRPGSAMSTSTTASGFVQKRNTTTPRKPRPASIAVTGVSLNDEQKQKKDKPPLPKIQSTPKRSSGNHVSSKTIDSISKSNERKSATKRDITPHKLMSTSMTQSIEQKVMKTAIIKEKQSTEKPITEKMVCDKVDEIKQNNMQISNESVPPQTKEEKDALNTVKTEIIASVTGINASVDLIKREESEMIDSNVEIVQNVIPQQVQIQEQLTEKIDDGTEKETTKKEEKENTEKLRELSAERQDNEMTASMLARSKITTEEEAKAALAERRRIAKEKAEREAELERQRIEAERQAELKRQAEEEEKQRKFEEEAHRLAEAQRKAEEERLLQAIEEAKKRELEEKLKKEEEERLRAEKEENERKAKEEAEKQRLEMAERLKREEKEREERRKRVEEIMSRTRARGGNPTPNSTPIKDNESSKEQDNSNSKQQETTSEIKSNNETSTNNSQISKESTDKVNVEKSFAEEQKTHEQQNQNQQIELEQQQQQQQQQQQHKQLYEQSVTEKENSLMKSFNNLIIDENAKNIQNAIQNPFMMMDMTNGKMIQPIQAQLSSQNNQINNEIVSNHPIANGNGHIENNLNKNDTNSLINVSSTTNNTNTTLTADQLIDFSNNESQQQHHHHHQQQQQQQQLIDVVNFTNNNLLTTTSNTTTLVTADSHENQEISLL